MRDEGKLVSAPDWALGKAFTPRGQRQEKLTLLGSAKPSFASVTNYHWTQWNTDTRAWFCQKKGCTFTEKGNYDQVRKHDDQAGHDAHYAVVAEANMLAARRNHGYQPTHVSVWRPKPIGEIGMSREDFKRIVPTNGVVLPRPLEQVLGPKRIARDTAFSREMFEQIDGIFPTGINHEAMEALARTNDRLNDRMPGWTGRMLHDPEAGNLPYAEYQFWVGQTRKDSLISRCRFCSTVVAGPEKRKAHKTYGLNQQHNHLSCMRRIQLAGKGALARSRCLSCGAHTKKSKWGVPLCGAPMCEYRWKFTMPETPDVVAMLGQMEDRTKMRF